MTEESTQSDLAEQLAAAKLITDHQFKQIEELEARIETLQDLLREGLPAGDDALETRLQAQDRLLNKYEPIMDLLAKDYQWDSGTGPSLHYIRNMARAARGVKLLTPDDYKRREAPRRVTRSAPVATQAAAAVVAAAEAASDAIEADAQPTEVTSRESPCE